MSTTIKGSITEHIGKHTVICNYCDCVSSQATGLTGKVFNKYPMSDTYKKSHSRGMLSVPGTISVIDCGSVWVVNMYAQTGPGKPIYSEIPSVRKQWFAECLDALSEYINAGTEKYVVVFPHNIGCGEIAGNKWSAISPLIEDFAKNNVKVTVIISEDCLI